MDKKLLFTGPDHKDNWFYNDWYYCGANMRYFTWHVALNILNQTVSEPAIVETGCQRLEGDIGGGMSTQLFCEYISRYGGSLVSVDISPQSIAAAVRCTKKYDIKKDFYVMDSVKFLEHYEGGCDLVYLDSYDYPIVEMINRYNQKHKTKLTEQQLGKLSLDEIDKEFSDIINPCQDHCVKELKAIESRLTEKSILLLDDNQLPGGGKPRKAKEYLLQNGWTCLLDLQQSLWIRSI